MNVYVLYPSSLYTAPQVLHSFEKVQVGNAVQSRIWSDSLACLPYSDGTAK